MGTLLTPEQRQALLIRHRGERDRRVADRIKAVILYDEGWGYADIAHALLLTDEAIRKHVCDFIRENKLKPENGGSEAKLDAEQTAKLLAHLDEQIYVDVRDICDYVWVTFGEFYSRSGMTQWLGRNGFSYHKPARVPAKVAREKEAQLAALKAEEEEPTSIARALLRRTLQRKTHQSWYQQKKQQAVPQTPCAPSMGRLLVTWVGNHDPRPAS